MDAGVLLDLLGNQNRRRILRLIARKPCYVTEISEQLGVSPKAVIDHLRRLEEAGLVESRTDDQRRKYFHIARNLRLEVTLAPYGFGVKTAYPASPGLDLSSCQHLSLSISGRRSTDSAEADGGAAVARDTPAPARELAEDLAELEALQRELSLAQRWVQGRIASVIEDLSDAVDGDRGYVDAEVIAAVARGTTDPEAIAADLGAPTAVVEECLRRLAEAGLLSRAGDEWRLEAEA